MPNIDEIREHLRPFEDFSSTIKKSQDDAKPVSKYIITGAKIGVFISTGALTVVNPPLGIAARAGIVGVSAVAGAAFGLGVSQFEKAMKVLNNLQPEEYEAYIRANPRMALLQGIYFFNRELIQGAVRLVGDVAENALQQIGEFLRNRMEEQGIDVEFLGQVNDNLNRLPPEQVRMFFERLGEARARFLPAMGQLGIGAMDFHAWADRNAAEVGGVPLAAMLGLLGALFPQQERQQCRIS